MPTRSPKGMWESQLKDENLKKIIESFESTQKTEECAKWTERGFLMNQGVLYRYVPDSDSKEAQLAIPTAERDSIMRKHHDDPMSGHYGEEGTFQRIARHYYWTELEAEANAPRPKTLRLPTEPIKFCVYMIEKYGENYNDMAKDPKNHYQDTPAQIRKKILKFKSIPCQWNGYLRAKGLLNTKVNNDEYKINIEEIMTNDSAVDAPMES
ncbi:uncharacterized protein LOC118188639 [Stegodyphus dumicola]|uniref:uncharacterized protein LOC118188639 n=1 Tax=Stegodyphus dumicola TaxID=202533 RepID=UPI0015AA28C4|nr:uncharacterized protein LOC118188639 [Stegodyphus dumicola]